MDTGDTLTYWFTGTDASSFSIVSTSGQLRTSAALNYEAESSYNIIVNVRDSKDANGNADTTSDDTHTVTINVDNVIAIGEGFTSEFKQAMPSDLGREICAFANASGGVILIGVDDGGEVVGVEDHNRLKSQVQSFARGADPPIAVEVESVDEVLCVNVPEQQSKPYSFGGRFFIREGASSQQLSRDEIREFFFEEGLIRMDETPCTAFDPAVDLTIGRWEEFAERAGIEPTLDPTAALENLHLLKGSKAQR